MKGGKSSNKAADNKLAVKRGSAPKAAAKGKQAKDPNKPKRPASAFFIFMEDFRKQFKEKHPNNKSVSVVGKAGGEKWKSMTEAEKRPFVVKAEKRKAEYEKTMDAYNKGHGASKGDDEDSDKSKSEVHDEDEDEEDGSEEEDEE